MGAGARAGAGSASSLSVSQTATASCEQGYLGFRAFFRILRFRHWLAAARPCARSARSARAAWVPCQATRAPHAGAHPSTSLHSTCTSMHSAAHPPHSTPANRRAQSAQRIMPVTARTVRIQHTQHVYTACTSHIAQRTHHVALHSAPLAQRQRGGAGRVLPHWVVVAEPDEEGGAGPGARLLHRLSGERGVGQRGGGAAARGVKPSWLPGWIAKRASLWPGRARCIMLLLKRF